MGERGGNINRGAELFSRCLNFPEKLLAFGAVQHRTQFIENRRVLLAHLRDEFELLLFVGLVLGDD